MKRIQSTIIAMLMIILASLSIVVIGCASYDSTATAEREDSDSNSDADTDTDSDTDTDADDDSDTTSDSSAVVPLPCDIFEDAGAPCVSAHSTTRVLRTGYTGPLYQLCKGMALPGPDSCQGETMDINAVDGYADAAAHEEFCGADICTISIVYDQAEHDPESGPNNDLEPAPLGGAKSTPDKPVNSSDLPVIINGHNAYGMLFRPGMGYRAGCDGCKFGIGTDLAIDDMPQTIYMITSANGLNDGCCFDYGNAETTCNNDHNGTMEAIYFGGGVIWGSGSGDAPWVMADLEDGLYAGWENNQDQGISTNTTLTSEFVTGILVGDTADKNDGQGRFALYAGDATEGGLTEKYDGIRPEKEGYVPMQKQGSLILGIGGDNSGGASGYFYEAAIVNAALDRDTLDDLQAAIVAANFRN